MEIRIKENEIAHPGMNNTNKKPKIILKNPKKVIIISAIFRSPALNCGVCIYLFFIQGKINLSYRTVL
jgi:hypothetical protein